MYRSVFWVTPDSDRHHSGSGSTVCVESKNSNLSLFKLSPNSTTSSSPPGFYFLLQCGSAVKSSFHSSPPVLRPRQRASSSYHISLVSVALSLVAHSRHIFIFIFYFFAAWRLKKTTKKNISIALAVEAR